MTGIPQFKDVVDASERLQGHAVATPMLESAVVNRRLGGRLLLKAEPLQHTGSFKFRGAFNRLSRLTVQERSAGVVAFSSGNHAQGVAAAALHLGVPATIVMPSDAPGVKTESTRELGAEVISYDRRRQSREEIAAGLARERGAVLVPSFDDFYVIAGQGTLGLEFIRQASQADACLDELIVPCGGGGLIAGCALAANELSPRTSVFSAEPSRFNDHELSLAEGRKVRNRAGSTSICDALLAPEPGELTFEINRTRLCGGLSVSDDDVCLAMAFAFRHFKLVVEPGGAVALAAVLAGRRKVEGRTIGIVCSGGNVDRKVFADAIGSDGLVG
jgi:threonine dehydratase